MHEENGYDTIYKLLDRKIKALSDSVATYITIRASIDKEHNHVFPYMIKWEESEYIICPRSPSFEFCFKGKDSIMSYGNLYNIKKVEQELNWKNFYNPNILPCRRKEERNISYFGEVQSKLLAFDLFTSAKFKNFSIADWKTYFEILHLIMKNYYLYWDKIAQERFNCSFKKLSVDKKEAIIKYHYFGIICEFDFDCNIPPPPFTKISK